jgi:hypothetical protein
MISSKLIFIISIYVNLRIIKKLVACCHTKYFFNQNLYSVKFFDIIAMVERDAYGVEHNGTFLSSTRYALHFTFSIQQFKAMLQKYFWAGGRLK